jgi:putative DNA primase/helicase
MTEIAEIARGHWRLLLPALGVPREAMTLKHGPCPFCGGTDRYRFCDFKGSGSWICNQCGNGDGFDLVLRLTGGTFGALSIRVREMLGAGPGRPVHSVQNEADEFLEKIRSIWAETIQPKRGSPVGLYLTRRVPGLTSSNGLREHPALFNPATATRGPAMIAVIRGPDGHPVNLHCTFLTTDGHKVSADPAKRVLRGPLPDGCAIRLGPVNKTMGIAEGIENALSASILNDGMVVWSAVNGGLLSKWSPPPEVQMVHIFADNDQSFTGQAKAYALANRLVVQFKIKTMVHLPNDAGDWNDALKVARTV